MPYLLIRSTARNEKQSKGWYQFFQGDGKFARPIFKEDVEEFLMDAFESEAWTGQGGFQLVGKS